LYAQMCHPADLHPFPTRRSSDLFAIDGNPIEGTETLTDEQLGLVGEGAREYRSVIAEQHRRASSLIQREETPSFLIRRTFDEHRDRKSTRLNSSHVSISYAVFCL